MSTRRDILTGFAVLPVLPALPGASDAQPAQATPAVQTAPELQFLHEIDARLWRELSIVEQALERVKARLLEANRPSPLIRNAALFDMRCSFQTLAFSASEAGKIVPAQRDDADSAYRGWKADGEPEA